MKYNSLFEIIGPVMVGPSSSHTAGAVRLGRLAREIFAETPETAEITFYGSFASTYKGHGTDVALVAGLLGLPTADPGIPEAMALAAEQNLQVRLHLSEEEADHPNSVDMTLRKGERTITISGVSLGGGLIEIRNLNGFPVRLDGENPALLVVHRDQAGVIARVTARLAIEHINISRMDVSRRERGQQALMVIASDQKVPPHVEASILGVPGVELVTSLA